MVEHWCRDRWRQGGINECLLGHSRQRQAMSVVPFDQRTNTVVEGVAKTGQVSPKGTVAHTEHFDGRVDAKANVSSVTAKLSELRRTR